MASGWVEKEFPVHWLVWNNDHENLNRLLSDETVDRETKDPRSRTPLHLAVTLGHLESVRVLLRHGANANAENSKYWTVVQEAVCTGDPEILQLCLQHRDFQRYTQRSEGVPGLLQRLREAPDFYVEMKWEFTSWVPLVSRMCPSDTYRVWKSGSNVRIDTTLLGFDNMNWQRGSRSYVFKGEDDAALVMEIDHDARQIYCETMQVLPQPPDVTGLKPSEDTVAARITTPVVTTYIDTEKISFERSKSGIWGWRSDKSETVNTYPCKVFSASNVELVTKTRSEHLTDHDKQKVKKDKSRTPLESFLGIAEQENRQLGVAGNGQDVDTMSHNPCHILPEEYFNSRVDLGARDIGRPIEQTTKTQKFKAQLCLCEQYPLSLPEQVAPIIDLMAATNAHFRKLKDFITLQLPAGFPVKIEIPLFHILNARITFGNIYATDSQAPCVTTIQDNGKLICVVEESCFEPPNTYSVLGDLRNPSRIRDEDDQLLQFAIQQSLVESGTENDQVTLYEALHRGRSAGNLRNNYVDLQSEEERMLQQAIEESMMCSQPGAAPDENPEENTSPPAPLRSLPPAPSLLHPLVSPVEDQLRLALEISQREQEESRSIRQQEEDELEMILRLSLTDK